MKRLNLIITAAFLLVALVASAQPGDLPPNQEPGKCYAKCLIADEYETVTEQVLVRAASKRVETVPAEYESVTEQVLVKEAATRIERVKAEYETVTERMRVGCPSGYNDDGVKCTKLMEVPATYKTVEEQVLVKEASVQKIPVPAEYETVTEQVVVKEASKRVETTPATYETASEQVLVKEASSRIERVPAEYKTETERIEVKPANTKWIKKKADRNCLSADPEDCLVWCLVEVPAEYRTVTKQVRQGCPDGYTDNGDDCTRVVEIPAEYGTRSFRKVKTPATTREIDIPAEYASVTKRVIKTPASVREVEVPAEYRTIKKRVIDQPTSTRVVEADPEYRTVTKRVRQGCPDGYTDNGDDCTRVIEIPAEYDNRSYRKLKSAADTREIEIPAEYATVTKRRLVKAGGFTEWREVLCGDKLDSYTIRQIQNALKERGYSPGPIDNILGRQTKSALTKYQKDNGLPIGQLDKETLRSLGVSY